MPASVAGSMPDSFDFDELNELGFLLAIAWVAGFLRFLTSTLQLLVCLLRSAPKPQSRKRRGRRALLWELCRAAAVLQKHPQGSLIRNVWETCLEKAREIQKETTEVKMKEICQEISKASEGLCFESLAWRLARALACFEEDEVARFLKAATSCIGFATAREEGQSEEVYFGLCRSEVSATVVGILLENNLIHDVPLIEIDPWFQIKRYGYAFACFHRDSFDLNLPELQLTSDRCLTDGADAVIDHPTLAMATADSAFAAKRVDLEMAVAAALRCFLRCPAMAALVPQVVHGMARELNQDTSRSKTELEQEAMEALRCCGVIGAEMQTVKEEDTPKDSVEKKIGSAGLLISW